MAFEDIQMEFVGFDPTEEVQRGFDQLLKVIYAESPSGCFIQASLSHSPDGYQGEILVSFQGGEFRASGVNADFKVLRVQLGEQIRFKLQDWRRSRFASSTIA